MTTFIGPSYSSPAGMTRDENRPLAKVKRLFRGGMSLDFAL